MSYNTNYADINRYRMGGLLPYPFDYFIITRNSDDNIEQIDFFQNGASGRKVMTMYITYTATKKKESVRVENYMTENDIF